MQPVHSLGPVIEDLCAIGVEQMVIRLPSHFKLDILRLILARGSQAAPGHGCSFLASPNSDMNASIVSVLHP
jgi:hypothetical protein